MSGLNVFLQLGWLREFLPAVLTMLSEMNPVDVLLSVLLQLSAVAALVDDVEVLGHPTGLDHLHTKITPSLSILQNSRWGKAAAPLLRLDGLRDDSLGPAALD